MSILRPKGWGVNWTCDKDNIIEEMRNIKLLDYMGLIINYLKKRRVWGAERDYTVILI